jgi:hypothetical protein
MQVQRRKGRVPILRQTPKFTDYATQYLEHHTLAKDTKRAPGRVGSLKKGTGSNPDRILIAGLRCRNAPAAGTGGRSEKCHPDNPGLDCAARTQRFNRKEIARSVRLQLCKVVFSSYCHSGSYCCSHSDMVDPEISGVILG